jgi:hypothetical protein
MIDPSSTHVNGAGPRGLYVVVGALLGCVGCGHQYGQTAFGVSAELLRLSAASSCAFVDVKVRNHSTRPAFILVSDMYPYVSSIVQDMSILVSLHDMPRQGFPNLHSPPTKGYRISARSHVYLRVVFPLHLRMIKPDGFMAEPSDFKTPISVRVGVGVLSFRDRRWLELSSSLGGQKIAQTDDAVLKTNEREVLDCDSGSYVVLTRRDPNQGIRKEDLLLVP